MKKVFTLWVMGVVFVFSLSQALALDPVAPRSFRSKGMLWVKTPNPRKDIVKAKRLKTGEIFTVTPGKIEIVPVGRYLVQVSMQGYEYSQKVLLEPTERTDVVVPGYGNLIINSHLPGRVVVYGEKSGQWVAKFPVNVLKTLPRGHYEVKIIFANKTSVTKPDIWVVTNTTRHLDVIKE